MGLNGCCGCGLRGGAKAIGVFFLVITLVKLLGVIAGWALWLPMTTDSQGFGVNTPEGTFGVRARETHSFLDGRGGDLELDLGKLGSFGVSASEDGRVSVHTPGGDLSNSARRQGLGLVFDWIIARVQAALIVCTVYVLLEVSFNSMLIHGTDHDSSCAVLSWLVFYGIHFVLYMIAAVGCVVIAAGGSDAGLVWAAVLTLLVGALLWYWWAVVLTFHRQLCVATRGYKYQRDVSLREQPVPFVPGPVLKPSGQHCA